MSELSADSAYLVGCIAPETRRRTAYVRFAAQGVRAIESLDTGENRDRRTSMVALYHRSRSRIRSVTRVKNLFAPTSMHCHWHTFPYYGEDALKGESCMIFQMCTMLLWVAEPIDDACCDDCVMHCLVYLCLQLTRVVNVRMQRCYRVHEVLSTCDGRVSV